MGEIIPISNSRARRKRPINIEFTPRSFPGQRFSLKMDWNDHMGKWTLDLYHITADRSVTSGSTATPYRVYEYMPYMILVFKDPSGNETEITPSNLGDEMRLYVMPGPSGRAPEDN